MAEREQTLMAPLLESFIRTFQKAITTEMEAMRRRLGPFEVSLSQGRKLDAADGEADRFYTFKILRPNDKLVLQAECTLRYEGGEALVTITQLEQDELTLRTDRVIGLTYADYTLVIYPWFLYEKLQDALASLLTGENYYVDNALLLFGQGQPQQQPYPLQTPHEELNASQRRAVQLCSDSNVAFVWGPPGTGKTTTLGHIVTELLGQGQRLLLTSTTNAAVDQALAKMTGLPELQKAWAAGQIVRVGQTDADTCDAGLSQVVKRLNRARLARLEYLRERCRAVSRQLEQCDLLLAKFKADSQPLQLNFFNEVRPEIISAADLTPVFLEKSARALLKLTPDRQQAWLIQRRQRLATVLDLSRRLMTQLGQDLRRQEEVVIQQARVVLATMTNVYLSSLLQPERFDAVVVEEAGMAILPTLFYCAALARKKVIMVGDPQQLPPIVQSRDEYVYRAMGRNIFEVAAQKSLTDETMVMLDIQYRMHPVIGNLVSQLFYEGKLSHAGITQQRDEIAARPPYPGVPLVVLDTAGQTTCITEEGGFSRLNDQTAQRCVELAVEAVRAGVEAVAIITPYVAQSRLIRQYLSGFRREAPQIECRTVHRFQGGERDMVILDTVDTAPLTPGVLLTGQSPGASSSNLLNVSLSRARGKLVIIADVAYFNRHSPHSLINQMLAQSIAAGVRAAW